MTLQQLPPRTYGGWRRSRGIGLFGLGTTATFILLGLFILLLVVAAIAPGILLYLAPPVVVGCAAGLVRVAGTPLAQLAVLRVRWWLALRSGSTLYRAEALLSTDGSARLPGVPSALELLSAEDGYGGRYGLVRDRCTGYLTATLRVVPASTWLADRDDADGWVAAWGSWLASLGHVPMLRWVTVTVDTAPEPGTSLADAVTAAVDPAAPEPAREIMASLVAAAPGSAANVDTRISLTFDPAASATRPRTLPDAVAETGRALYGLQAQLGSCGTAVSGRLRAAEIAGVVRAAYDPASRGEVNRALAGATELPWSDAGPAGADELWDRYRHDSGVSVSWAWREAPRSNVHADVLARLTAPGVWPKRVTLQFRPLPAAAATRVLENEVRAAEFRQEYARRTHRDATARDAFDHARVRQAAMEEAQGAGVSLLSLYVTVTAAGDADLLNATAVTEAAAGSSRIQLHRLYGSQAAAFTVGLPCGICLPTLSTRGKFS